MCKGHEAGQIMVWKKSVKQWPTSLNTEYKHENHERVRGNLSKLGLEPMLRRPKISNLESNVLALPL